MEPHRSDTAYFFGCWRDVGHYWWRPVGGGRFTLGVEKISWREFEYGCPTDQPWGHVDGKLYPRPSGQSEAALHHKDGWTALAMVDRTVDSRPGSNSVFMFHATLDFDQAVDAARAHFPGVVERIEAAAPITEGARTNA